MQLLRSIVWVNEIVENVTICDGTRLWHQFNHICNILRIFRRDLLRLCIILKACSQTILILPFVVFMLKNFDFFFMLCQNIAICLSRNGPAQNTCTDECYNNARFVLRTWSSWDWHTEAIKQNLIIKLDVNYRWILYTHLWFYNWKGLVFRYVLIWS